MSIRGNALIRFPLLGMALVVSSSCSDFLSKGDERKSGGQARREATPNGDDATAQGARSAVHCQWAVAESFPVQVSGRCQLTDKASSPLTLPLPEAAASDSATATINDTTIPKDMLKLDGEGKRLVITSDLIKAGAQLLVTYRGRGEAAPPAEEPAKEVKDVAAKVVDAHGLDGCAWLLELSSGEKLDPTKDLPTALQVDGLAVTLSYKKAEGIASVCMAGKAVEITAIKTAK